MNRAGGSSYKNTKERLWLAERDQIRKIQDKVIVSAERTGLPDDYKTNLRDNNGHDITIGDLRKYIYPQFKRTLEDYIRD